MDGPPFLTEQLCSGQIVFTSLWRKPDLEEERRSHFTSPLLPEPVCINVDVTQFEFRIVKLYEALLSALSGAGAASAPAPLKAPAGSHDKYFADWRMTPQSLSFAFKNPTAAKDCLRTTVRTSFHLIHRYISDCNDRAAQHCPTSTSPNYCNRCSSCIF